jgi:hypothetical protein
MVATKMTFPVEDICHPVASMIGVWDVGFEM